MSTLSLYVHISGHTNHDLVLALDEAKRRIENGYIEGADSNDTGSFYFKRQGNEWRISDYHDACEQANSLAVGARVIGLDEHGLAIEI
jgi:hypothetical protein